MCGIAGVVLPKGMSPNEQELIRMRDSMVHRGPDAAGIFVHENIGLAHRRLSIIDLSEAANQPFFSPCGQFAIVFNGEIFNHQTFRSELENKGFVFRTQSDTEVLLYLLMAYGTSMLHRLVGFWAFAFLNIKDHQLLLVRDRMGVKPLFYTEHGNSFSFASEPKALFAGGLPKEIEEKHIDELFFYRHVSGENTIFKEVKRLLPGYLLLMDTQSLQFSLSRWFHLGDAIHAHPAINNPLQWFEEQFRQSIQHRMIADVPVGTLLSGGLDSSSVLLAQYQLGFRDISAWNIHFSNFRDDESMLASRFSQSLSVPFHSYEFEHESLVSLTKEAIHISDEPFMHYQEPHLLGICRKAKEKVTVLLSGEAADELMGGYIRYKVHDQHWRYQLLQMIRYIPNTLLRDERWRKMKKYLYMHSEDAQLLMNANQVFLGDLEALNIGGIQLMPTYRVQQLSEAKNVYPNNPLRQLLYLEQFTHLPSLNDRNDRVSMGASIECREPFQDNSLYTGVMSMPDRYFPTKGKSKWLLMNSFGKKLPPYITSHRKVGLSIPWNKHIHDIPYFRDCLMTMDKSPLFQKGIFHQIDIQKIIADVQKNSSIENSLARQLFFLSLWYKEYFEGQS